MLIRMANDTWFISEYQKRTSSCNNLMNKDNSFIFELSMIPHSLKSSFGSVSCLYDDHSVLMLLAGLEIKKNMKLHFATS